MTTLDQILVDLKKRGVLISPVSVKDYGNENGEGAVWLELKPYTTIYIEDKPNGK